MAATWYAWYTSFEEVPGETMSVLFDNRIVWDGPSWLYYGLCGLFFWAMTLLFVICASNEREKYLREKKEFDTFLINQNENTQHGTPS